MPDPFQYPSQYTYIKLDGHPPIDIKHTWYLVQSKIATREQAQNLSVLKLPDFPVAEVAISDGFVGEHELARFYRRHYMWGWGFWPQHRRGVGRGFRGASPCPRLTPRLCLPFSQDQHPTSAVEASSVRLPPATVVLANNGCLFASMCALFVVLSASSCQCRSKYNVAGLRLLACGLNLFAFCCPHSSALASLAFHGVEIGWRRRRVRWGPRWVRRRRVQPRR